MDDIVSTKLHQLMFYAVSRPIGDDNHKEYWCFHSHRFDSMPIQMFTMYYYDAECILFNNMTAKIERYTVAVLPWNGGK